MKVAAGRGFYTAYGQVAQQIAPQLSWALIEPDGSWSTPPDDCELVVLAGDAYRREFIETTSRLPSPRWAHTEDAGTDGPFYDAMHARGALITHSPGANAPEVAEFVFGCVLWSAKRLGAFQDGQRRHEWTPLALDSLSDKTLLVVGLGAIGQRVASLAKAFGMRVLGIRRSACVCPQVDRQGTLTDLAEYLTAADYVVLALPVVPETERLIGAAELARLKPSATLVNVARGAIVDEAALKTALRNGALRQACLDVLPREPWPADDDLWDVPNLLLTPHTASSSPLYGPRVAALWLDNLRRYVRGEPLRQVVEPHSKPRLGRAG